MRLHVLSCLSLTLSVLCYLPTCLAKNIHLNASVHLRLQYQFDQNASWKPKEEDNNGFQLSRFYTDLNATHPSGAQAFAQLISAHEAGRHPGPKARDEDHLDFQQLYLSIPLQKHRLKFGRQSLKFGKERMIGTLHGPNYKPFFDGLLYRISSKRFETSFFRMHGIQIDKGTFNNSTNKDWTLQGLYHTHHFPKGTLESYALQLRAEGLSPSFHWDLRKENTLGWRYESKWKNLNYDLEMAYQFDQNNLRAFALMNQWQVNLPEPILFNTYSLDLHYYSGDSNPYDSKRETFRVPYPKGANFGESGLLSPANVAFIKHTFTTHFSDNCFFKSAFCHIWKSEREDAIYNMQGKPLLTQPTKSRNLGQQLDFHLYKKWSSKCTTHLQSSMFWVSSQQHEVQTRLKKLFKLFIIYKF